MKEKIVHYSTLKKALSFVKCGIWSMSFTDNISLITCKKCLKDIPGMKCMPCEIKPIVEGYLEYKLSKPEYDFADSRKV